MNNFQKSVFLLFFLMVYSCLYAQLDKTVPIVKTTNGILAGSNKSGINIFKGIPFAAPPVGDLRWKEPQPVVGWTGVRKANHFGPRPMQENVFGDMNFRSDSMSEDCLYLNIWTPAVKPNDRLPVLVYFYGGGLIAGSGCEPRYDGESMARNGIVSVTVNYRLGIFGFFSHPELTKESPNHSSGNYGYLDQAAALKWLKENIAVFGGDPDRITIAGESAGSISVSAQMCSPLSKSLIAGAIGSSGSLLGALPPTTLENAEAQGEKIASKFEAKNLSELRNIPAEKLLRANEQLAGTIDGYFFPEAPIELYKKGMQAKVPLLIGWNSQEMDYHFLIGDKEPTPENFKNALKKYFGDNTGDVMQLYGVTNSSFVLSGATQLAGDLFIACSSWKWSDIQAKISEEPVFRYLYCHPRPVMVSSLRNKVSGLAGGIQDAENTEDASAEKAEGAVHSADIEYAMGNLSTNRVFGWQPEDYEVSAVFQSYYVNFIKTGNPNGVGLPQWTLINEKEVPPVLNIDVNAREAKDSLLEKRYRIMDSLYLKPLIIILQNR